MGEAVQTKGTFHRELDPSTQAPRPSLQRQTASAAAIEESVSAQTLLIISSIEWMAYSFIFAKINRDRKLEVLN
jgi:hypothetical protein